MNINPQVINMLKGGNPQQIALNMLKQNCSQNPLLQNVLNMANSGNLSGVESVARNMCRNQGINADEMIRQIKTMM